MIINLMKATKCKSAYRIALTQNIFRNKTQIATSSAFSIGTNSQVEIFEQMHFVDQSTTSIHKNEKLL